MFSAFRSWQGPTVSLMLGLLIATVFFLGCPSAPEPECTTEALESCQRQRAAAVERTEYLEGELADAAVSINNLEAMVEELEGRSTAERPCLRREVYRFPAEEFCWVRVR